MTCMSGMSPHFSPYLNLTFINMLYRNVLSQLHAIIFNLFKASVGYLLAYFFILVSLILNPVSISACFNTSVYLSLSFICLFAYVYLNKYNVASIRFYFTHLYFILFLNSLHVTISFEDPSLLL